MDKHIMLAFCVLAFGVIILFTLLVFNQPITPKIITINHNSYRANVIESGNYTFVELIFPEGAQLGPNTTYRIEIPRR